MKLETGDILLVDTEGFIPSNIDTFQGNDYNHAGFIVNIFGISYVFEAIKSGMAFTNFDDYLKRTEKEDVNLLILRPRIGFNVEEKKLMNFILPLTQKPYGYTNLIIYQAIKYITRKLGKEIWMGKSKAKSTKKFICGKLVAYIYNYFTGMFPEWYKAAPVDLYNSKDFKHIKI